MRSDWRERLLAYDDDQLDPAERRELDDLLDREPEAREFLQQLRADRHTFRAAFEGVKASAGFADQVMGRLPAPRPHWVPIPRLLEVFAAGLAVLVLTSLISPLGQRERRNQLVCQSQVRDLSLAMSAYTQDYDGHFPPAGGWAPRLAAHQGAPLPTLCPSDRRPVSESYALPISLSGASLGQVDSPGSQVMLFENDGPFPAPRHGGDANAAFVDGSVRPLRFKVDYGSGR